MSRIHIELIRQNSIKEWAEEQNRHFLKKASKSPPVYEKDTQYHNYQGNVFQMQYYVTSVRKLV